MVMTVDFNLGDEVKIKDIHRYNNCPGRIVGMSVFPSIFGPSTYSYLVRITGTSIEQLYAEDQIEPYEKKVIPLKCDCGSKSTDQPGHSHWCLTIQGAK